MEPTTPVTSQSGDGEQDHAIPTGPMARWFTDRVAQYGDLPAAYVKRGGSFEPVSYREFETDAREVAAGLLAMDLESGDRVAIRAETRYEWSVVDLACVFAGLISVPVYPSFSTEQTVSVLERTGTRVLVREMPVDGEIADAVETVVDIAALPRDEAPEDEALPGFSLDDDDVLSIIPTSGTTGMPKGVVLTHRNVLSLLGIASELFPLLDPEQTVTCFLPLNHIYQRAINYLAWHNGQAPIYMHVESLVEEFVAMRPTVLATVPRVYRRFYDGIQTEIEATDGPKGQIARWAMGIAVEYGRARESGQVPAGLRAKHAMADRLVYGKLREKLGLTDVEYALTAAASLDAELLHFFWGIGVPLVEVYGATETTGGLTFNTLKDFRAGTVGSPGPGLEVTLGEEGEVLARGPTIMREYWNQPAETAAAIDEDGWYHTGDVGEFEGDKLRIVDRMKRMQVLDTGKNVFPAPIETQLRRSDYVDEAMVVAEGRKYVTALVQPNFERLLAFADEQEIAYDDSLTEVDEMDQVVGIDPTLLENTAVKVLFDREVGIANDALADYEQVKEFALLERALSIEREELTPTLKKRRDGIETNFGDRIDSMYA